MPDPVPHKRLGDSSGISRCSHGRILARFLLAHRIRSNLAVRQNLLLNDHLISTTVVKPPLPDDSIAHQLSVSVTLLPCVRRSRVPPKMIAFTASTNTRNLISDKNRSEHCPPNQWDHRHLGLSLVNHRKPRDTILEASDPLIFRHIISLGAVAIRARTKEFRLTSRIPFLIQTLKVLVDGTLLNPTPIQTRIRLTAVATVDCTLRMRAWPIPGVPPQARATANCSSRYYRTIRICYLEMSAGYSTINRPIKVASEVACAL